MISRSRLIAEFNATVAEEASLVSLRDAVVSTLENKTGRLWKRRSGNVQSEVFASRYSSLIRLQLRPIETIELVEVKSSTDGEWTTAIASTYFLDGQMLTRSGRAWEPFVRITYTGGYADDQAPAEVGLAIVAEMKFQRAQLADTAINIRYTSLAGSSSGYSAETHHPLFKALIDRSVIF